MNTEYQILKINKEERRIWFFFFVAIWSCLLYFFTHFALRKFYNYLEFGNNYLGIWILFGNYKWTEYRKRIVLFEYRIIWILCCNSDFHFSLLNKSQYCKVRSSLISEIIMVYDCPFRPSSTANQLVRVTSYILYPQLIWT